MEGTSTAAFLNGKSLLDPNTLKGSITSHLSTYQLVCVCVCVGALEALSKELVPSTNPVAASADYRKNLAIGLFYKVSHYLDHTHLPLTTPLQFYLEVLTGHLSPIVASAAVPYVRPLSSGQQSYPTDPTEYPITKPMPKLTASLQVRPPPVWVWLIHVWV